MKVTSTRADYLLLRAKGTLGDLFAIIDLKQEGIRLPKAIYVHSLVRRLIFMCTSLRHYFIDSVNIKSEVAVLLTFEEIIALCCERELFSKKHEPMMRKLGHMHTRVTSYDGRYQSLSREMVSDVPEVLEFLDLYISQKRAQRLKDQVMHVLGQERL